MSILVFGASSQIGYFLLPRLLARGESVIAASRQRRSSPPGVRWLQGSLPLLQLPSDIASGRLAAVISFAPLEPLAHWLAQLDLPPGTPVIATSSMSAITKEHSAVAAERQLAQQLRNGENALAELSERASLRWIILRPTLIYGAGLDKSLTPIAQRAMRTRCFPLPPGRGLRQPVHADDIASAVLAALDTPAAAGQTLAIGGGERLSAQAMFARVRSSLPAATLPLPVPHWCLQLAMPLLPRLRGPLQRLQTDLIADNGQLTRILAIRPRPFQPLPPCWGLEA